MISPADILTLPFDDWVNTFVRGWLVPNFRPAFRAAQMPISTVLSWLDTFFRFVPMLIMTAFFALTAWKSAGRATAIFTVLGFAFIDMIGLWSETMTTLAMIITSVLFCAVIGIPAGILAARFDRLWQIMRPLLDVMQTIPSFVYLVPIVMLFGVGMAPGIIATIVFALPPIVRLTNLGIRNVRGDLIEAAHVANTQIGQAHDRRQRKHNGRDNARAGSCRRETGVRRVPVLAQPQRRSDRVHRHDP